jgi:hypothetical protein
MVCVTCYKTWYVLCMVGAGRHLVVAYWLAPMVFAEHTEPMHVASRVTRLCCDRLRSAWCCPLQLYSSISDATRQCGGVHHVVHVLVDMLWCLLQGRLARVVPALGQYWLLPAHVRLAQHCSVLHSANYHQ